MQIYMFYDIWCVYNTYIFKDKSYKRLKHQVKLTVLS